MTPLSQSKFSKHFIRLKLTGGWIVDRENPKLIKFYAAYKIFMIGFSIFGVILFVIDLFLVFGDFRKVTWNLCITTLFAGSLIKSFYVYHHNVIVEKLRMRLHRDEQSRKNPEYEEIHQRALKNITLLERLFYIVFGVFVPMWLVVRFVTHYNGEREWPIPLRLPWRVNEKDDVQYILWFVLLALCGIIGLVFIEEIELCMFSLMIQIMREYAVLLKDISKINELFEGVKERQNKSIESEINPYLRHHKAKMIIKGFAIRQQKIIEYTEAFETCYSLPLLLQFFVVSILIVTSSMQCIIESENVSANLSYQIGYLVILTLDMFMVCWFATKIHSYCQEVGEAVYFTHWYEMSVDIQRDLYMILIRSQRPPKITSGKFITMNLHAFMILMRNIYSWLTLFQQLEVKVSK